MKLTTLCYLQQGQQYLMLHRVRKQQDDNRDKWLGVGGKFLEGESPEDCLLREVWEETGLKLEAWQFRGIVTFVSDRLPTEYMHLFTATRWSGQQRTDCPEGDLAWIDREKLRELTLWAGDRIFLQLLEQEAPFFSLKLCYRGEQLTAASLNGKPLPLD